MKKPILNKIAALAMIILATGASEARPESMAGDSTEAADREFRLSRQPAENSGWSRIQTESSPDTRIFRFINSTLSNSFLDRVMPFITDFENFRIIVLLIWSALVIFGGSRGRWAALALIPIVAVSDQLTSSVFKPLFQRLRPCEVLGSVRFWNDDFGWITTPAAITRAYKSSFSFPSAHAANITSSLIFLGLVYRKALIPLAVIAAAVSFSRIYTGVHWPLDTLGGIVLGLMIAIPGYLIFRRYSPADRDD
ncbi:MAG: phosphatase PAP2 family protein [Candidatus Krumholzibacteriales bacterium]